MNAILIPVKELAKAKQRLAAHFSPEQRIALADALWQDFFDVVAAVRGVDRVFVISLEPRVLHRAQRFSWETIPESRQTSETDSVDFASRVCAHFGVKALLRLPVDLPLAGPLDIENIWRALPDREVLRSTWAKRSSAARASRFCAMKNWKRISTTGTTCARYEARWWRRREPAPGWNVMDLARRWRARPALSAED